MSTKSFKMQQDHETSNEKKPQPTTIDIIQREKSPLVLIAGEISVARSCRHRQI